MKVIDELNKIGKINNIDSNDRIYGIKTSVLLKECQQLMTNGNCNHSNVDIFLLEAEKSNPNVEPVEQLIDVIKKYNTNANGNTAQKTSNTSKGRGTTGSKFWMQGVVEFDHLRNKLDYDICKDSLEWISPIAGDNYDFKEYKLNQPYTLEKLGISQKTNKNFFDFWPSNQPQWDGIAISKDKKTLYLIEAKAQLSELNSKLSATSQQSIDTITETMTSVKKANYNGGDIENWINKYYQLGNRLTFLKKMQEIMNVKLVLVNFVDDFTYKSTSEDEWTEHYKNVWKDMIGKETAPDDVKEVYYTISKKAYYRKQNLMSIIIDN